MNKQKYIPAFLNNLAIVILTLVNFINCYMCKLTLKNYRQLTTH